MKASKFHTDEAIRDTQRYIVSVTGQGPIGKLAGSWMNAVDERGLAQHCVADHWPDWNSSTSAHTKEDVKQAQHEFHRKELRRSIMGTDSKLNLDAYVDPVTSISNLNAGIQETKTVYQELKDEFRRELKVNSPEASEEHLQATAQRLVQEKLMADEKATRFPVQQESFRPNVSLTAQDRRYRTYFHTGSWSWNEQEKSHVWTCCMNAAELSRGCECKVLNPDAWCTLGYERNVGQASTWRR